MYQERSTSYRYISKKLRKGLHTHEQGIPKTPDCERHPLGLWSSVICFESVELVCLENDPGSLLLFTVLQCDSIFGIHSV